MPKPWRENAIAVACDGDYRRLAQSSSVAASLTIAEALEVMDD